MKPAVLTAAATLAALPLAAKPLNVIFFLADDMGYGDLHFKGNYGINTPNLDRFVTEGVRIDHFYVAYPICSPSRVGFTTGAYPQRWGITSYLDTKKANAARGIPNFLTLKAPTLAHVLQNAGYATGHFGKWHMGGQRDFGDAPFITEYGFDESLTNFEGLGDRLLPVFSHPLSPKWGNDPRSPIAIMSEKLGKGKCEWVNRWEVTGRYIDRAIQFIDENKKTGKPFYVNVWPDDPHAPNEPSPPFRGDGSHHTLYQGVVRELDREFGRLLDYVRNDPGLADNTLVIYASDNGPEETYGNNGNLRGFKGELYEGGMREPFVVWAPKLLAPERIGKINTTSTVSGMDLAPTILSILGIKTPAGVHFDGQDMSDVFLGRSVASYRPAPLFWSRPPERTHTSAAYGNKPLPDFAVRDGQWKLYVFANKKVELYDITDDPGEMLEKSKDNPQVVQALAAELTAWQNQIDYHKIFKVLPAAPGAKKNAIPDIHD